MDGNVFLKRLKAYYELTKPKTVWLLVGVGAAAGLMLAREPGFSWLQFAYGFIALTLSVAGTNAFTCWIDRDIDAVMNRTSNRPLPRGELTPRAGLLFSVSTFVLGLLVSVHTNPQATIFLILGFIFSAVLYNGYLKRRSALNVVVASPAGMMPILFMWFHLGGGFDVLPLLLGLIVVFWTPAHIWSLAVFYGEDYGRVNVPMLPLVKGERFTLLAIAVSNLLLLGCSILIWLFSNTGWLYLATALLLNTVLFYLSLKVIIDTQKTNAWRLFKFSSPYLALIFLAALLDRLVL